MNCSEALDRILQADPAVLRGEGDPELAGHLRGCARCRQRVTLILRGTADLNAALDVARPRARRRRAYRLAVPLALAATLAALLVVRQVRHHWPLPGSTPSLAPAPPAGELGVRVPAGRTVAVFRTDNPNIVVIWSF